jgi:hypothetical protein
MKMNMNPWTGKVEAVIGRGKSMGKIFPIALKYLLSCGGIY